MLNTRFEHLVNLINDLTGIDLQLFDENFVGQITSQRMKATGTERPDDYLLLIRNTPGEANALTKALYISYSEFFRNPLSFTAMWRLTLPDIIQQAMVNHHREIRIWSAACAEGQEAYSIAMLLEELRSINGGLPGYRIFATDLNEQSIRKAKQGVYDASTLQHVPLKFIDYCFTRINGQFTIHASLKKHISFSAHDLLDTSAYCPPDCIYGDFDLVLCCNLLFYYQPAMRRKIIEKITRCLRPGGYMVTGEAERDMIPKEKYTEIFVPAAIYQKKAHL